MALRSITVQALAQRLALKEETLKQWMSELSVKGSRDQGGVLTLDPWEVEYLSQAKDFYVGYQRDFERVKEALQRWVSRHPKPEPPALSPDDDLLDLKSSSDGELQALPVLPPEVLSGRSEQVEERKTGERKMGERRPVSSRPPSPRRVSMRAEASEPSSAPRDHDSRRASEPPAKVAEASMVDEVNRWKSHFQNAQRDLRRLQDELDRAREKSQQQHAVIKQLQSDFNALKELIRKEVYDLRDLVVDKKTEGP